MSGQKQLKNCMAEKMKNYRRNTGGRFVCIFGLSSVLGTNIHIYYPDCGKL